MPPRTQPPGQTRNTAAPSSDDAAQEPELRTTKAHPVHGTNPGQGRGYGLTGVRPNDGTPDDGAPEPGPVEDNPESGGGDDEPPAPGPVEPNPDAGGPPNPAPESDSPDDDQPATPPAGTP